MLSMVSEYIEQTLFLHHAKAMKVVSFEMIPTLIASSNSRAAASSSGDNPKVSSSTSARKQLVTIISSTYQNYQIVIDFPRLGSISLSTSHICIRSINKHLERHLEAKDLIPSELIHLLQWFLQTQALELPLQ